MSPRRNLLNCLSAEDTVYRKNLTDQFWSTYTHLRVSVLDVGPPRIGLGLRAPKARVLPVYYGPSWRVYLRKQTYDSTCGLHQKEKTATAVTCSCRASGHPEGSTNAVGEIGEKSWNLLSMLKILQLPYHAYGFLAIFFFLWYNLHKSKTICPRSSMDRAGDF